MTAQSPPALRTPTGPRFPLRLAAGLVLFGLATFLVFPTEPLYSQNQHTKFLYGLAMAGIGRLREDWLIGQGSGLPIFDALIYLSRAFAGEWLFYLWHVLAVTAYAVTICGFALVVGRSDAGRRELGAGAFLTLFAAWFLALNSNNATGRLFEGVAHQYLNGPVFDPASLGVLALVGLLLFRLGQPGWAAALIVAAAWVHPAYAIPGLMLLAGMAVARLRFGNERAPMPVLVLAAGALGCLGAAGFTYSLLQPSDPAVQAEAVRIITQERIAQHSLPEVWFDVDAAAKLVVVAIAIWLTRRDPLGWVLMVVTAGIIVFAAYVWISRDMQLALAAPWRASAIIVPAANAIVIGRAIEAVAGWTRFRPGFRRAGLGLTALAVVAAAGLGAWNKADEYLWREPKPYHAWVRDNARAGDVYLTPVGEEDFRLATGQPQYVSWKSHPHRGAGVLAWRERIRAAEGVTRGRPDCAALERLAGEGVTHLVREAGEGAPGCPGWSVVYDGPDMVIARR